MKKTSTVYMLVIFALFAGSLVAVAGRGYFNGGNFWIDIVSRIIIFALFLAIFLWATKTDKVWGREIFQKYAISHKVRVGEVIKIILLTGVLFTSFLLIQGLSVKFFELFGYQQTSEPLGIDNIWKYLTAVMVLAILPAIFEELIFRGYILQNMMQFGRTKAIIASSILFSLYHMSPAQTIYQFVLGVACAMIVIYSGKLVLAMLLHFVNNFIIVTYTYLSGGGEQPITWTSASTIITVAVLVILGSLTAWSLIKTFKTEKKWNEGQKKFATSENIGYFICIAIVGAIWITTLLSLGT